MWQWYLFVIGSVPIVWISRGSLRSRDAHGFYRFFAFEAILALIAVKAPVWFDDPFAPRQLMAWALLLASFVLAVHGFYMLRRLGRPDHSIADRSRLGIEKTTRLVRLGAYHFIRHPLYTSLLALAWGAFLKGPSWPAAVLLAVATAAIYLTARVEERENLRDFGQAYQQYMRDTRMFIPYVF